MSETHIIIKTKRDITQECEKSEPRVIKIMNQKNIKNATAAYKEITAP